MLRFFSRSTIDEDNASSFPAFLSAGFQIAQVAADQGERPLTETIKAISATNITAESRSRDLRWGMVVVIRDDLNLDEHIANIGFVHFTRLYRLSPLHFVRLCNRLRLHLSRTRSRQNCAKSTQNVETMLCITMRILAGASYLDIGWPYSVGCHLRTSYFMRH